MRPGGVPARPGQPHQHLVAGRGNRPRPEPHLPHGKPRVAVERENPVDPFQTARVDHFAGPSRQFLGRLEQPDPAGQRTGPLLLGEEQAGGQHDRGVHVVSAGVCHARDSRPVGNVLLVVEGQRVNVGTQCHRRTLTGTDIADQPSALGETQRFEPGVDEPLLDPLRRAVLRKSELGMPVKVAAELDKLPFPVRQEHGQLFAQVTPLHARDPHFSMDLFDHGSTRPRVPQPGTL